MHIEVSGWGPTKITFVMVLALIAGGIAYAQATSTSDNGFLASNYYGTNINGRGFVAPRTNIVNSQPVRTGVRIDEPTIGGSNQCYVVKNLKTDQEVFVPVNSPTEWYNFYSYAGGTVASIENCPVQSGATCVINTFTGVKNSSAASNGAIEYDGTWSSATGGSGTFGYSVPVAAPATNQTVSIGSGCYPNDANFTVTTNIGAGSRTQTTSTCTCPASNLVWVRTGSVTQGYDASTCYYEETCSDVNNGNSYAYGQFFREGQSCGTQGATATCFFTDSAIGCNNPEGGLSGNQGVAGYFRIRDTFRCDVPSAATPECSDGIDNDNDGTTDYPNDKSCSSASDTSEFTPFQCSDGYDNDGDGKKDYSGFNPTNPDLGCTSSTDNNEEGPAVCGDGTCFAPENASSCPADCL